MQIIFSTWCFLAIFSTFSTIDKYHLISKAPVKRPANNEKLRRHRLTPLTLASQELKNLVSHQASNRSLNQAADRNVAQLNQPTTASTRTVINNEAIKTKLLGQHRLSLQWISWDYFGQATVTDNQGLWRLSGKQKSRQGNDYLTIEGIITSVEAQSFTFEGQIRSQISHINNGQPCLREGKFTFQLTKNRPYWRLKEMENPCDGVVDYIDIYFRKEAAAPSNSSPLPKKKKSIP